MADINEKVNVETDAAVENLGDLKKASQDADEWISNVIDRAKKADGEEVSVPVETPGAVQAADELDHVDTSARKAGEGAKVGTSHISDMTGPFGDASGAASTFGQAIEGAGGLVESMAGKMGLSEEATGKLTAGIGIAAVAVGAAAAAWTIYNASQDAAKKGLDETRDALGKVYDKLREGDAQAAAETFIDTMGDKIDKFRTLVGDVSKADIAGAIFGDPASIANVDAAIGKLDGTARVLATGGLTILEGSWKDAKQAADENIALTDKVKGFFGDTKQVADDAKASIDGVTAAYGGVAAAAAAATAPVGQTTSDPYATDLNKLFGAAPANVTNIFPPANTPSAVESATQRWAQVQGPR